MHVISITVTKKQSSKEVAFMNKKRLLFVIMMCAVLCLSSMTVSAANCPGNMHTCRFVCGGQEGSTSITIHYYGNGSSHIYGYVTHRTVASCTKCPFSSLLDTRHTVIDGHRSYYGCGTSDAPCPY